MPKAATGQCTLLLCAQGTAAQLRQKHEAVDICYLKLSLGSVKPDSASQLLSMCVESLFAGTFLLLSARDWLPLSKQKSD